MQFRDPTILADSIRDQLTELGVVVTDTATGPEWDLA